MKRPDSVAMNTDSSHDRLRPAPALARPHRFAAWALLAAFAWR